MFEILSNLKNLSKRGTLLPEIAPKLVDQKTASEMLGVGYSNFRKLERAGEFPFKRTKLGGSTSVRFCNIDIINYIMGHDEDQEIDIEE